MSTFPFRLPVFVIFLIGLTFFGATSARAQAFPPGSYQRSCTQIHWAGTTLVAECQKRDGGRRGTGLPDAARCRGDIANIDGFLQCVQGGPPPAVQGPPPVQAPPSYYGGPQQAPGYPPPGGYGYDEHRAHCEELWHREHELRDRLQYLPYGPDREHVEYELHETHERRERFGCGP